MCEQTIKDELPGFTLITRTTNEKPFVEENLTNKAVSSPIFSRL